MRQKKQLLILALTLTAGLAWGADARRPMVAANWKMNKNSAESVQLAEKIKGELQTRPVTNTELVVCPSYTAMPAVGKTIGGSQLELGAQNVHAEKIGAYTGDISVDMLKELGCQYVILGHGEQRQYHGETHQNVRRKVIAVLAAGMKPIICVGETESERASGMMEEVITEQVRASLSGVASQDLDRVILAYEPVWSIGTGKTPTPADAETVHALIRRCLAEIGGQDAAMRVRILYGGSVNSQNAAGFFGEKDIDGALIGKAGLDAKSFVDIARIAENIR